MSLRSPSYLPTPPIRGQNRCFQRFFSPHFQSLNAFNAIYQQLKRISKAILTGRILGLKGCLSLQNRRFRRSFCPYRGAHLCVKVPPTVSPTVSPTLFSKRNVHNLNHSPTLGLPLPEQGAATAI